MPLILAIEPDRRQAAKVGALAESLRVELIIGEATEWALGSLGSRVPDLVLTSQLLSPKDEAALAERLRELGAAGAHVQTLVIPVLKGEEREQKKKGGGLFGRLRRSSPDETTEEGCDPAVFGAEIVEYLERGAAERAALAAAQADLEAAWAEEPAAAPPAERHRDVDVHPEMVIEDPEALFGEFAAIPIRRSGHDAPDTANADADVSSAWLDPEVVDAPRPQASSAHEEEWEEIPLDIDGSPIPMHDTDGVSAVATHTAGVELTPESLDLHEFVRELETVPTTAHAEPMIPLVDLSHVVTGESPLEPTAVTESELRDEARATFEAEVTAVFASESASANDPDVEPVVDVAEHLEAVVVAQGVPVEAQDVSAESDPPRPDAWRVAIDGLVLPEVEMRSAAELPTPLEPAFKPKWQDMLSAIRRDIAHLRTPDESPAPPTPAPVKPDFSSQPLVFPARPSVAASVLAGLEWQANSRTRQTEDGLDGPAPTASAPTPEMLSASIEKSLAEFDAEPPMSLEPAARGDAEPNAAVIAASAADPNAAITTDPTAAPIAALAPEAVVAEPAVQEDVLSVDEHLEVRDALTPFEPEYVAPIEQTVVETPTVLEWLTQAASPTPEPEALSDAFALQTGTSETLPHPDVAVRAEVGPVLNGGVPPALEAVDSPVSSAVMEPEKPPMVATPAPTLRPFEHPGDFATPSRHRQPKSKKKRRHGHGPQLMATPTVVPAPLPEWGFFDPQKSGFGPLLARLNQSARATSALPLR